MFWRFNVINTQIDSLLDKEDITLQEILDEDDVLQECKAQNPRLLEFLVKPENMDELVNWVTSEPKENEETEEKHNQLPCLSTLDVQSIPNKLAIYKFPNIACELLTSDCPQITEKLVAEEAYLIKIYSFLEQEGTLNPLLASFFSKVMGLLIARKSELMLDFLKAKEDCVGHLLRHIGTSAIMDLLLRLITCIESPETRLACVNWLNDQSIIQKLVSLIDADQSEDKHCNASQSLCDIIRLSRDQMSQLQDKADPDPLLATIESTETVSMLLDHMFRCDSKVESVLINGLQVIQTLLEFRKAGFGPEGCQEMMTALDRERLELGITNTLKAVIPRLKDFNQILTDPPKQHYLPMPTSMGALDVPLGNTRLQTVRLLSSILVSNSPDANLQLANLSTLGVLLDLFFKFSLNNFLHTQVELCLCTVLNSSMSLHNASENTTEENKTDNPLLSQLFTDLKLVERILDAWEENEEQQKRPGGHRKGYMGHLTHISNTIMECLEKGTNSERLKELFQGYDEELQKRWETFTTGTLAEANKTNTLQMVGGTALHSSSDSEDPDFSNINFPQESAMQQAFSDYQLHQMTSTFIDQFGFKEDEFNETEERVDAPFTDRISSISFEINSVDSSNAAATLFEQACSERLQQFDEQDSDEDLWEEKEITFTKSMGNRPSQPDSTPSSTLPGGSGSPMRRRADARKEDEDDEAGGNSSDESTDSEDELNSPQKIYQTPTSTNDEKTSGTTDSVAGSTSEATPAENMEVSENFANFDNFPVDMDTGSNDNWAKFDEMPSSTKGSADNANEGWADFSNLEEMESSEVASSVKEEERSGSPVAMDTAETAPPSNRMAQYMVSSSPDESASSSNDSQSIDSSQQPTSSSSAVSNETSPPSSPRDAWNSAPNTPRPSDDGKRPQFTPLVPENNSTISSTTGSESTEEQSAAETASSSENSGSNSSISSTANNQSNNPEQSSHSQSDPISSSSSPNKDQMALATSTQTAESATPMDSTSDTSSSASGTDASCPSESLQEDTDPSGCSKDENSPTESSCQQNVENSATEQIAEVETAEDLDEDEELSDNFNFLSGLMGRRSAPSDEEKSSDSSEAAASASSTQDSQVNSSTSSESKGDEQPTDPDSQSSEAAKLEAIRAEAREALDAFSSAASSTSNQNGPVG